MKSQLRRVMVGNVAYAIEINHAYPLTEGWQSSLQNACRAHPAAVVWDDLLVRKRRGFRPEAFRLVWPTPDKLFYPQVDHAGRCAVRADFVDDEKPGATSRALLKIIDQGQPIDFSSGILRFTRSVKSSVYNPIASPPAPSARADKISVIVNYRDQPELMEACLESLASQRCRSRLEVLLIDNQSSPESLERIASSAARLLSAKAEVRHIRYDKPFNKSAQDNLGVETASGDVTVMMNNDAALTHPDTLQTICDWAATPGVASAGPLFTGAGGRLVSSGVFIRPPSKSGHTIIRENELATFASTVHYSAGSSFGCAAVSKAAWTTVGPLDTETFRSQYNDADVFIRALRMGLKHVYVGTVSCHHEPGRSEARTKQHIQDLLSRLMERHPDAVQYAGTDPDLIKYGALPRFESAKANAWMKLVQKTRQLSRLARTIGARI
ncbi:glycosyltransferase family 2 protein [Bradyrhizobium algeriense]|uniref:glycosyltransferase family 2 protein n=1 Tax=Bradyrhizobium algeriense TaxID=634784 RepID=UPI00167ED848|nr:glycosyltransferase [Bradyrhizobium algeriense]